MLELIAASSDDDFRQGRTLFEEYAAHVLATDFGARWAAFSRASVLPTLALDLDGDQARRDAFVARMEAGMASRLAAHPEPAVIPLAMMVIAR